MLTVFKLTSGSKVRVTTVWMSLRPPGHHLMELTVGEFRTNSWVAGSNVAVVSRPLR